MASTAVTIDMSQGCKVLLEPYYGIILEYLHLKEIFPTMILISKYHSSFMKNNQNKKLIERIISNQIGSVFKLSSTFNDYYYHPNNNPSHIIKLFHTDFGFIQSISFPEHHQKVMKTCSEWRKDSDLIDWDDAALIFETEIGFDNDDNNPYCNQYNAIQYDEIPFRFINVNNSDDILTGDTLIKQMKNKYFMEEGIEIIVDGGCQYDFNIHLFPTQTFVDLGIKYLTNQS